MQSRKLRIHKKRMGTIGARGTMAVLGSDALPVLMRGNVFTARGFFEKYFAGLINNRNARILCKWTEGLRDEDTLIFIGIVMGLLVLLEIDWLFLQTYV